jgi:hypothetical protein
MREKRTNIDYSKHDVKVIETEHVTIHHLRLPDTIMNSVKFINTEGILAVTGDFGNWIFCREFVPGPKNAVSDGYWCEKLKNSSCQQPFEIDWDAIEEEIKSLIDERIKETDYEGPYPLDDRHFESDDETLMFLVELFHAANNCDKIEYEEKAFRSDDYDHGFDYEYIPYNKKPQFWLLAVFDAFDEICARLKQVEECSVAVDQTK